MEYDAILEAVELFEGATPQELASVAALCQERTYTKGDIVTTQGEPGAEPVSYTHLTLPTILLV